MPLRDYQDAAVQSIFDYYNDGNTGNPIIALPPGTGKSWVIAAFLERAFRLYPTTRVFMLTHVKELIEQNYDKLMQHWPEAPASIYSAGLKQKSLDGRIVFAGIGSIKNVKPARIGPVDLLLIDECHLVSPRGETMYRQLIENWLVLNPKLKIIGLTATPYRLGLGLLTDGGLFTDVCFDLTTRDGFLYLLEQGWLAPLIPKRPNVEIDLTDVHTRGGEFVEAELQQATDREELTRAAVQEMIRYGTDRKRWLVFASGVEHADHVRDELRRQGITAEAVHSKMPSEERDRIIDGFRRGEFRAITNNNILTTGFDVPEIDLIGMLRATKSTSLWVQALGRGTRPAPGKTDTLVLDFAGNTPRLGPINDPILPRARGIGTERGEAPVKECSNCHTYVPIQARVCPECGFVFPQNPAFTRYAGTAPLIAGPDVPQIDTFKVDEIEYTRHDKAGKPPSMKVTYQCGLLFFNEWVCFEHEGYPGVKAKRWWEERAETEVPESTNDALSRIDELEEPISLRVWHNQRYPEILAAMF